MCDSEIPNLIDLSIEDEMQHNPDSETERLTNPYISSAIPSTATEVFNSLPPGAPLFTTERRDSLDNNPFDCAQKLVDRPDDPFEIVEKEACYKARHSMVPPTAEVKLANLLSLSDDNILNDLSSPDCASPVRTALDIHRFGSNSTMGSTASTIYHSAIGNYLDNESPPISMSMKSTPDSGSSAPESFGAGSASSTDGSGGLSGKKKALEYRKRLLKLSIANSTFSSPVSRHMSIQSEASALSAIFAHCGDHMLASESPLKLVDDDEGKSEDQTKFLNSEKDFDADLEMLKIPILQELPSPIVDEGTSSFKVRSVESSVSSQNNETSADCTLPDLAAIRDRLRTKREKATNDQDISALLLSLKSLISNIDAGDDYKKRKANSLLETLSSTLACCSSKEKSQESNFGSPPPKPIVRQGTFDIELQENDENSTHIVKEQENVSSVSGEMTQSVQSTSPSQEIPDAMIKSSATYDGEGVEEREGLILPIVEPFSSPTPPKTPQKNDVNDIIEQISKLLEQHQLSQATTQCENTDGSVAAPSHPLNPTFIVVMNAPQIPQHDDADSSFCNISPDSVIVNAMRRRSQSLSLHDKVKIVQIPMRPPTPVKPSLKKESETSTKGDTPEFKTPSRMIRRNSFSIGTPYTPRVPSNYGAAVTTTKRAYGNPDASRRLSTHHEGQHSVLRRAMNFPHANFNSQKPDLKKKVKSNADSIMKSSLPLKATIPLKKVAPTLRTSPPTPETASASNATIPHKPSHNSLNSSVHASMPLLRSAGTLSMAAGYPNACSTPTGAHYNVTPLKRIGTGTNKPRYSYNSTTPTAKQVASASAAAAGLKRRTLNEFKAKSPIKPRLSHTAVADVANAIKNSNKTSMRLQTDVPRTSNSIAASAAATSSSRIASSRLSMLASINHNSAINKNKENKYL